MTARDAPPASMTCMTGSCSERWGSEEIYLRRSPSLPMAGSQSARILDESRFMMRAHVLSNAPSKPMVVLPSHSHSARTAHLSPLDPATRSASGAYPTGNQRDPLKEPSRE